MKKLLPRQEKTQLLQPEMKKKLSEFFGILFEGQYQFENFVVGSHNNLAHSAAQAVASKPGEAYNPLFIYGQVGLGKTHLMQAIGNAVIKKFPEKVVVYLPTSKLIDEIIDAIQKKKLTALIKKFEQVDVLLLDDVQFLADKEKTQEIFYTLFNDFHSKKKQVVLSSDRPPIQLNGIEPRLKSRFAFGLVVDVQSPDYETRVAILQSKVRSKHIDLPSETLHQIAHVVKDNVRELE
jgi:chromosomal replication initiator protein